MQKPGAPHATWHSSGVISVCDVGESPAACGVEQDLIEGPAHSSAGRSLPVRFGGGVAAEQGTNADHEGLVQIGPVGRSSHSLQYCGPHSVEIAPHTGATARAIYC
jgi:hypothetical protein